jgi:hypothetical protein
MVREASGEQQGSAEPLDQFETEEMGETMSEVKRRGVARPVNLYAEPHKVYCGRPGKGKRGPLGNPYVLTDKSKRGSTIACFTNWMDQALDNPTPSMAFYPLVASFVQAFRELKARLDAGEDLTLGCFCLPQACHTVPMAARLNRGSR